MPTSSTPLTSVSRSRRVGRAEPGGEPRGAVPVDSHPVDVTARESRYPAPTTVSINGGSPSFLRSVITVTRTVVVNGSVFASHTRSSSSSLDTTAAARLEQLLQDAELLAGQVELDTGPGGDPLGLVEHQVATVRTGGAPGCPPAQGPDPGHQPGEVERLGQVVVGAQAQPLDPVGDRTAGGQHQYPGQRARRDQVGADRSPCTPGRSRSSTSTS